MTNFERYKEELTMESFVASMIINCDGCPDVECPCRYDCVEGIECEKELQPWCEEET